MHCSTLLREEASARITTILVHVGADVVEDDNDDLVLISQSLECLRVLQQEVRSLNEVDVAIGANEVVADRLDVVNDEQSEAVRLDALRQVHEHLVVVFECLTVREYHLAVDVLLADLSLV